MPNITIEYVILIPLLFIQLIVFPFVASTIASNWQESQRDIALQSAADHLASTVQQLYLSVNREEILAGSMKNEIHIPATIDSIPYEAMGSLGNTSNPNSSRILTLTLTMENGNVATSAAVMGSNVNWIEGSVLWSSSSNSCLEIQKFSNNTIIFSFGG
jgi:hypothetical protein